MREDTRGAVRKPIKVNVNTWKSESCRAGEPGDLITRAVSTDISVMGIGIISSVSLPKDTKVILELEGEPLGREEPIFVEALTRYCLPMKEVVYRCGFRFLNPSDALRRKILLYADNP